MSGPDPAQPQIMLNFAGQPNAWIGDLWPQLRDFLCLRLI
jgi:hypothetical protein